ncbi:MULTISPECIES: DUF2474 family protein [Halomonadaceae]|jgi:hypothetical protein|uniref:Uncharacterized protein n=1 Tax=Vreelandella titanicae TaxID=664683 RepID=A0A1G8MKM3_9GAMM|nr:MULTISPECIES: DUF2474 family protein [Halomonas]MBT2772210.1 DUF2474 domain-containing protein [Halomonas sp. ISL-60]MBT2786390.1 DUF2474 domain-containing protein [Halomonas sp. ISL-106]MBT2797412.1 DUF2474 domain-containing protein [Halomonas sp. ISL-104]MBT2803031.1 DUF2474 domain-containing protein [Halomonas sp. ISL-56]MCD1586080.1 DUF2474 domain-containing protein [Halomonas sp. IOP_14]|tara:strand:+ start:385 stop:507 length:123 start_codon:yes stop_codon:yes gene_type:complete
MKPLAKRLGWLVTIWLSSVGVLLLISLGLKFVMGMAGLTS